MTKRISIIGVGISRLSVARFLVAEANVQVLEKAEKVGGLVRCDYVSDNLFHKVGGHVFNAKNKKVFDWFWKQFDRDREFVRANRNAKILYDGKLIGYPLENNLFELDKETVTQIVNDLLCIQKTSEKTSEYSNFEEFLKGNFGDTLYQLYFKPYNQKIWNTDLSHVALAWLEGKIPMPDIKEIMLSNITREAESGMVHAAFYYPRSGGSQFIANRLAEGLSIHTNYPINNIVHENDQLTLNNTLKTDKVVYTGDVRRLADLFKTDNPELRSALESVRELKSNGTSNLFCECDTNDLSWLYIPGNFTRAHRIIYTGNFSPTNNAGSSRKTCVVEFSGQVDLAVMQEEIQKLPGNLSPLSFNYEPNSYVIQDAYTRQRISQLKALLQPYGFYLTGRFAEWEYYNMDKAIEAAQKLAQQILSSQ